MEAVRQLLLGCVLVAAACGMTSEAQPQSQVVVTSVVGIHAGKCGPRRAAEVQRAIATLTPGDFAWANRCRCMYETHPQLVTSENIRDRGLKPALQANMITINLKAPIVLPDPKSRALSAPTVQLVAKALVGDHQTILWLGHEPERMFHGVTFSAYIFKGDPFQLTIAPGQECGI